jgi:hypothetical protein
LKLPGIEHTQTKAIWQAGELESAMDKDGILMIPAMHVDGTLPNQVPNQPDSLMVSDEDLAVAGGWGCEGTQGVLNISNQAPVAVSSEEVSSGLRKRVSRVPSRGQMAPLCRNHSTRRMSAGKKKPSGAVRDEWDVFISYRVNSDAKLAEQLYWQLSSTEIADQVSTRRLRVFWDKGERVRSPFSFSH